MAQALTGATALGEIVSPHTIAIADTAAQIGSLNASQIVELARLGVTQVQATNADVTLTTAQQAALGSEGISLEEPYSGGSVQIIEWNASGALQNVDYLGVVGKAYTSFDIAYGSNGKPASETWTNGGTLYQTETWNSDGSFDIRTYAAGTFQGAAYVSYDNAYTASNFRDLETFYGAASNVVATETFQTNGAYAITVGGVTTQTKTVNADGSYDVAYYGITGQPYTSYEIFYNSAGKPTSETWSNGQTEAWSYNSSGLLTEIVVNGIPGQKYTKTDTLYGSNGKPASETWTNNGTLYQAETWNSDGSYDIRSYAAGTFQGAAYVSYDNAYTASNFRDLETFYGAASNVVATETFQTNGGYAVTVGGVTTQTKTVNADGSYDVAYYGITGQPYTSYEIFYSSAGKPTSETWSNGQTEAWSYNSGGLLTEIVVNGIPGQKYTETDTLYGSNGKPTSETWTNNGTLYQAETWNSDGSYDVAYYGITGQPYTSYEIFYSSAGKPTSETWSNGQTEAWSYNSGGLLTEIVVNGIPGQKYTKTDTLYGSNGKPASETWTNSGTLYQTETWNSDGSFDLRTYAAGTFQGAAYVSYDNAYTASNFRDLETFYGAASNVVATETFQTNGAYAITVGGVTVQTKTVNADGSYDVAHFDVTGLGYSSYEDIYNSVGAHVAEAQDLISGAGTLFLDAANLTVSSSAGQLGVTAGSDTFQVNAHASESIVASGQSAETFAYGSGFGQESITGFLAGGTGADLLNFSSLNPSLGIEGQLPGGTVAADSIGWLYSAGNAMIYVNDTTSALPTSSASLMEVTLKGLTSGLSASNFKA